MLQQTITVTEFVHWIAFWEKYPMGEEATDARHAMLMAGIYNIGQSFSGKRKLWSSRQFQPFKRGMGGEPQSEEELVDQVMATFKSLGMETDE